MVSPQLLYFWLITHIRHIIYRDKCKGIFFVDEVHQLLILRLIYDGDDLISFLHIVSTVCLFFLLRDDAHTSFNVMVKDKMIQNDSVEISSKDTQNDSLLVINKCGRKCNAHA